jgi:hypothetical protein
MSNRVVHDDNAEARNNFMEFFDRVTAGAKWMAAVWIIEAGGKATLVQNTTFQFPVEQFDPSVGKLSLVLAEEKLRIQSGPMLPDEPLPDEPILSLVDPLVSIHCPACAEDPLIEVVTVGPVDLPAPLPEAAEITGAGEVTGTGRAQPLGVDLPAVEEQADEKSQEDSENALE